MKEIERMPGTEPRSTNLDIKNPMDTEIKLKVENETVRAIVRWPNKAQEYIVMYAPIEIDPRLCPADTIDEHQKKVKFMKDGFEDIFHLTDPLQYNARYWLQVKGLKPSLEYDSVEFKTPACETPDDTCTKCKPNGK
ncbi:uncharacterized protein LOC141915244 [Tubulanus polymorphus]|uniref:uncharacterized protein LOC141915244 n=1 Tax=Tubulanus polymorphus TaxID=672921 RepID=UPI003DA27507